MPATTASVTRATSHFAAITPALLQIDIVLGDDRYNFNRGQSDIASAAPDDENGRFTEIGWAKPFDSTGSVTRTVTWTLGDPGSVSVSDAPAEGR